MPRRSALVLLLLLIVATPHTAHGKGKASKRRARHAATSTGGTGQSLQASLVPAGDPVLSGAQHAELAAARLSRSPWAMLLKSPAWQCCSTAARLRPSLARPAHSDCSAKAY